jgi:hypothetical protein
MAAVGLACTTVKEHTQTTNPTGEYLIVLTRPTGKEVYIVEASLARSYVAEHKPAV